MPDFVWRAAASSGKVVEGRLTAVSAALALRQLQQQGLTPLSIDDAASLGASHKAGGATLGACRRRQKRVWRKARSRRRTSWR